MNKLTVTVKQACELTGATKQTIYRLIFDKKLKATKVRQMIYINLKSLQQNFGG